MISDARMSIHLVRSDSTALRLAVGSSQRTLEACLVSLRLWRLGPSNSAGHRKVDPNVATSSSGCGISLALCHNSAIFKKFTVEYAFVSAHSIPALRTGLQLRTSLGVTSTSASFADLISAWQSSTDGCMQRSASQVEGVGVPDAFRQRVVSKVKSGHHRFRLQEFAHAAAERPCIPACFVFVSFTVEVSAKEELMEE